MISYLFLNFEKNFLLSFWMEKSKLFQELRIYELNFFLKTAKTELFFFIQYERKKNHINKIIRISFIIF